MSSTRYLVLMVCGLGACGVSTAGLGSGGATGAGGSAAGSGGDAGGEGSGGAGSGGAASGGRGATASGGHGMAAGGRGGGQGEGTGGRGVANTGGAGASETCLGGTTYTYVIGSLAAMGPVKITGGGTIREIFGFDLDGRDSDGTQPEDCGIIDGVSSDGRRGIDNTIAGLWSEDLSPAFQPGRMNGAISTVRLSGVDSFVDDDCVDVMWSTDVPQFRHAKIQAGRLIADGNGAVPLLGRATPLNSSSPVTIALPLSSPRISFRATEQMLEEGVIGGSVTVDQLMNVYRTLFGSLADGLAMGLLHPDLHLQGQPCALLSAGFAFEAKASPAQAN